MAELRSIATMLETNNKIHQSFFTSISISSVAACLRDETLQLAHSPKDAIAKYSNTITLDNRTKKTVWVYYRSPKETWDAWAGSEGWLLIETDPYPYKLIYFFVEGRN